MSTIQFVFEGVRPVELSDYYADSSTGFTAGVTGIPTTGQKLPLSGFRGKSKTAATRSLGILDSLSTTARNTVVAAYGLKLLFSSYTGPVVRVRRADNVTQDFYASTTGNLGTEALGAGTALMSWLNGAVGYVTQWYDQSGRNKHTTQATVANQPTIFAPTADGAYIYFSSGKSLAGPNVFDTATITNMHLMFVQRANAHTQSALVGLNGSNSADPNRCYVHSPWNDGTWYFDAGNAGTFRSRSSANPTAINEKAIFSGYQSSSLGSNSFRLNRVQAAFPSSSTGSLTVSSGIGFNTVFFTFVGQSSGVANHCLYSVVVFNSKLPTNDERLGETSLMSDTFLSAVANYDLRYTASYNGGRKIYDLSDNANHLLFNSAPSFATTFPRFLTLAPTHYTTSLQVAVPITNNAYSIEVLFSIAAAGTYTLFSYKNDSDGFGVQMNANRNLFVSLNGTTLLEATPFQYALNTWYHVVFTVSTSGLGIYRNSVSQAVGSGFNRSLATNPRTFSLGQGAFSFAVARFYNSTLTAGSVAALYANLRESGFGF